MAKHANQYDVLIDLKDIYHTKDSGKDFLMSIDWEAIDAAHSVLSPSEFEVYFYLFRWAGKNKNDKKYHYSPTGIFYDTGISDTTARRVRKALEEYGYLVKTSNYSYTFVPYPDKIKELAKIKKAERILSKQKDKEQNEEDTDYIHFD